MGFFTELFNWSPETETEEKSFGRYSDAYKSDSTVQKLESSIQAFESEDYLKSIMFFLESLKNPIQENIQYTETKERIDFQFFQGSKVIQGYANSEYFKAEARVVTATEMSNELFRKLLERNFLLKYSRFALDTENNIVMLFNSYTRDAHPNKLYNALKEMAIHSDKMDDIIIDEYQSIESVNTSHLKFRPELLKQQQFQLLIENFEKCCLEFEKSDLNPVQYPGAYSYLLLSFNYKIDYLLKPEGKLMDLLEHNHRIYFKNDGKDIHLKNLQFISKFKKYLERDKETIKSEFYDVVSTFGHVISSTHETLIGFIESELSNMHWYKDHNHTAIALAIPSYIVGYCFYNFALPLPDMKLLQLYYKITEPDFFYAWKDSNRMLNGDKLDAALIKKEMAAIIEEYKPIYKNLKIDFKHLDFTTLVNFSESYMNIFKSLDLSKAK